MREFLKTVPGKICLAAAALVLLAVLGLCGYTGWHYLQPKFHDVTIELGQAFPPVEDFLTSMAKKENATLLTENPDLSKAGDVSLVFSHNGKKETVTLTVSDTTAPTVKFQDVILDMDEKVGPEMFVAEVSDFSETTVAFGEGFVCPLGGSADVDVVVSDSYGNQTTGTCKLTILWMHENVTLELGQKLTKEMILLNTKRDGDMLSQSKIDKINKSKVGTYTLTLKDGDRKGTCTVTVQDTTAPTLKLKTVNVDLGDKITVKKFIKECSDASGKVTTKFAETPSTKKEGTQKVTIIATDKNGNKTEATATLKVHKDSKPPVFSGLKAMTVKKNSSPNFKSGVKATDAKDGTVEFSVNTSKVNLSKAGTYYATYTAKDAAGNKATARRKITVTHSDADTKELVKKWAAKLSNDPLEIMKYVRKNIKYNHNWGGNDPVWYGLKNKTGNCYVHAKVLEAIFKEKGIKTQIIYVTDKSHYWNLVYIDGGWQHIDSTPGSKHPSRIMNDEDRYNNLQGRDWDRSKWPKCE